MKRKILVILGALMIGVCSLQAAPAMAAGCTDTFLGMRPWYYDDGGGVRICEGGDIVPPKDGPNGEKASDMLPAYVWKIALNVLFDLFLAIGYIAMGFVIYGGYQYIMSQGDPAKAMRGKKTLTNAIVGTVIAMGATVIVNTVSWIIGLDKNVGWEQGDNWNKVGNVFAWAYSMAGLIAVIFIIKGGVEFMLSQGDPGKIQKAKRELVYAIVGLAIVILAALITGAVINAVGGAI